VELQEHGDEHLDGHLAGLVRVRGHQLAQHLAQVGAGRREGVLQTDGADVEVDGGEFVASTCLQDGNLVVGLATAGGQADGVTVEGLRLPGLVPIPCHVPQMDDTVLTQVVTTCDARRLCCARSLGGGGCVSIRPDAVGIAGLEEGDVQVELLLDLRQECGVEPGGKLQEPGEKKLGISTDVAPLVPDLGLQMTDVVLEAEVPQVLLYLFVQGKLEVTNQKVSVDGRQLLMVGPGLLVLVQVLLVVDDPGELLRLLQLLMRLRHPQH